MEFTTEKCYIICTLFLAGAIATAVGIPACIHAICEGIALGKLLIFMAIAELPTLIGIYSLIVGI